MVWFQSIHRCEKRDIFDALVGGAFNMATSAMNNAWSLENSKEMADYNKDISKELSKYYQGLEWENADYAKQLRDQSLTETPELTRLGLEKAGYNPILAINSAAGSPFSTAVNSPSGQGTAQAPTLSRPELPVANVISSLRDMAAIRQTEAQTDLIKRRTAGEGWQLRTLSRSEASGLGGSVLSMLGINLHDSKADTFLIAYNPITGEFRNLGDTRNGVGSTADTTNALDVPPGHVDVDLETRSPSGESYFWKMIKQTPVSPLR